MTEGTNRKDVKNIASALSGFRQDDLRIRASKAALSRSRGAIPATLGTGFEGATAADSGGGEGGPVGDLTEQSAGTRTFHAVPRQIVSTDGVFQIEIRDLKTIQLEDADGAITVFEFAQPS